MAWEPLGWEPVFFSEIEPFPAAVLKHHYPDVPNLGDMTEIDGAAWRGKIDLLAGGTPCQSFSVAGLRKSLDDDRSNLALKFVELFHATGAAWAIWENVPGVLNTHDNAFGCLLAGMVGEASALVPPGGRWTDAGVVDGPEATAAWCIKDAQYFRLAQRRRRLFVVVRRAGAGGHPGAVLFEPEGVRRDTAPSREAGAGVAALTANGVGTCGADDNQGQAGHLIAEEVAAPVTTAPYADNEAQESKLVAYGGNNTGGPIDVATAVNAHGGPHGRQDFESETFIAHTLRGEGFDASEDGTGRGTPLVPVVAGTIGAGSGDRGYPNSPDNTTFIPLSFHTRQDPITAEDVALPIEATTPVNAVAFHENQRGELRTSETAAALSSGGGKPGQGYPAVAYTTKLHNTKSNNAGKIFKERTPCLDGNSPPPALLTDMAVRRLTPRECEWLQGFPTDYTLIPYRSKPVEKCPDGPRYKALGNSWAVKCGCWLGERIALVEALM